MTETKWVKSEKKLPPEQLKNDTTVKKYTSAKTLFAMKGCSCNMCATNRSIATKTGRPIKWL